jgi:protein-tyrosine-phosphatase
MIRHGNRTIQVKKADLIVKIKENKENHIKEFDKAVVAYKDEALRQLRVQRQRVQDGALDAKLNLITPVDNSDNYDKILEMFEWEVKDVVELEQSEFQEYVQDTTDFAVTARLSNMMYVDSH